MSAVTNPEKPLTAEARRKLIAERTKRSVFWKTVHILGSLKLALLLLATIGIACAVATFYESSFNTKIARAYIYKAPWFLVWLGVLCVNLIAVTITRWPWQKKHTGFIVTHYGIVILLIGAVIGSQFGFEGNVTVHKDGAPVNRITTSRSVVQFDDPLGEAAVLLPFDAELALPSEARPKVFSPPGFHVQIVVDDHSDRLVQEEKLINSPEGGPGVMMDFSTAMMGQNVEMPFVLRADGGMERDFFGLARIAYLPKLPDRTPKTVAETRMVFAKFAPVGQSESERAGLDVHLSADGSTITAGTPGQEPQTWKRDHVIGRTVQAGDTSLEVLSYWPDFKLENGQPVSVSDEPNNPALLVRITGPAAVAGADARPLLEMAPDSEGVAYQLSRAGQVVGSGRVKVGESFALGWADWTATVKELLPHAAITTEFVPGPEGTEGIPGFRARLRDANGVEGPAKWVASGAFTTLLHPKSPLRVIYGLESKQVPFSIRLVDFEVPRLEGTETPSNFIATVEFRDSKTGETRIGTAKMNHPASWPGGPLALITGWNYKFSQAQWNPQDLGETTLQVLYDPGWLLKWFGSLLICAGIFIMFYIRPKKS